MEKGVGLVGMEMQNREGIENGRAAFAFEKVAGYYASAKPDSQEKYRSYVKKLPSMIQVNGLGQALAFCFSKGDQYRDLYRTIADWIREKQPELIGRYDPDGRQEFIAIIVQMPSSEYRLVSSETLALLDWMRRFADGLLR